MKFGEPASPKLCSYIMVSYDSTDFFPTLQAGDPEESLRHLYTLAYTGPPVPITWGPVISKEAVVVNQVASRYNVVQVVIYKGSTLLNIPPVLR